MEVETNENQREERAEGAEQLQYDANPLRSNEHAETQEEPSDLFSLQLDGNCGFPS